MITLSRQGTYRLTESRLQIKALYLDRSRYAMLFVDTIGEMIITAREPKPTDFILSAGMYRLYEVLDEPDISDGLHLELEVGRDIWQGYLLPNGLPDRHSIRGNLMPTTQLITSTPYEARLTAASLIPRRRRAIQPH